MLNRNSVTTVNLILSLRTLDIYFSSASPATAFIQIVNPEKSVQRIISFKYIFFHIGNLENISVIIPMYKKYISHNFLSFLLKKHFRTPINPCLIFLLVTIAIPTAIKIAPTQKAVANSLVEKISIFLYSPLSMLPL